ncbi:Zn-dependent exopeptidase [Basidiobolus meristosporus CBS 931.73]|uniref:Peptide hydrolase n=1 Tax=Basidiobolus meristosporus CBS 931.73 TaxID=1314790 RepID=A0A1Y1Z6A8_9FUNG|nr:Zn-dependent exopeptidase [Basidiobolus meristosporus CBS 931.73]|eukprot:ORY05527.1 Zn-dependent exopeptidase [Basidiobolus meristosporus CBS 931.73]
MQLKISLTLIALALSALVDAKQESEWLQRKITTEGLLRHTKNFERFSKAYKGTRVFSTPGHKLTLSYLERNLKRAGFNVYRHPFVETYSETIFSKASASAKGADVAFPVFGLAYTKSTPKRGLKAEVVHIPNKVGTNISFGCEAGDFEGVDVKGKIALIKRGECTPNLKSINAAKAGAVAALVYNDADQEYRGRLGLTETSTLVTGGISKSSGEKLVELLKQGPVKLDLTIIEKVENRTTHNIIAETRGGDPNHVVFLGAHSDSVWAGPGINDNGSGSAALLEVALNFGRNFKPKNKLRFGWFSAEEYGLLGSKAYVNSLSEQERKKITLMLNFDMIASPNYILRIYNQNADGGPSPPGTEVITKDFEVDFKSKNIPYLSVPFAYSGSDIGPFAAAGIPAGGLSTGAGGIKSEAEQKIFGGVAGKQWDWCYHLECDTNKNLNTKAFLINAKSIADAAYRYSQNVTEVVKASGRSAE